MPQGGRGEDREIVKRVRRELNRRSVDCSGIQVRVSYGVVYLTGDMKKSRGMMGTLKDELDILRTIMLHIPGIREVVDYGLRLVE